MQLVIRTNLYRLLPLALMLWPTANAVADYAIAPLHSQNAVSLEGFAIAHEPIYLSEGDRIAGYRVSSDYDLARVHPVRGTVEPHYGIDVATPTGTKLIAPTAIEVRCWYDINGGGEVAVVNDEVQLLHLSACVAGQHRPGETFALTGNSGLGTGEHLDARRLDKAEPSKQDIEPYLTGQLLTDKSSALSDRALTCSIGAAEGTRDTNCQPNQHYSGHTDPGNGATNLGSFSYQHKASSPIEADQKQLRRLRQAEIEIQQQAKQKFNRPLSREGIAAALDLWNQSPKAGNDFVVHLPSATPTTAQIVKARSQSYVDPMTGELDAPGLGNHPKQVRADQTRRTSNVLDQLDHHKPKR